MERKIKTLYVIHHSHTDIGYTDLQERVIDTQVDYIHTVLKMMKMPEYQEFRWNCETLFCVEEFWKEATEEEKKEFCELAAAGRIGLSATYLNFTDLLDNEVATDRLAEWKAYFDAHHVPMKTSMVADINGISMGYRDALLDNGVEFLFTNIHCHHGMYPLYQNQTPYFWENTKGQRLLVWNGEHYNLGNVLGLKPEANNSYMQKMYTGKAGDLGEPVEKLHTNLVNYLNECEEQGYKYNFIITSVSGVFSDNAPPAGDILENIQAYNKKYGTETEIRMVSLQELYAAIKDELTDAPVYHGDLTDWWADGVGSTPYAVKHYKEAQHKYHLCERLDRKAGEKYPELWRTAQDNLMLYAEHTWGHSSTITNPYDTMVLNLDIRKNSYASKAHEASAKIMNRIMKEKGDLLRYYNTSGKIRVYPTAKTEGPQAVEFYIETLNMPAAEVRDSEGNVLNCQVSEHPRGRRISFVDTFKPGEPKEYTYARKEAVPEKMNTRQCYMGAERVRDVVNSYDAETYHLPYYYENKYFMLSYRAQEGIQSLIDKRTGKELLGKGEAPFFTPMYQVTELKNHGYLCQEYAERSLMGRNIRGAHAKLYCAKLEDIVVEERGPVFTILRLQYTMPGSIHTEVILKFYEEIPRIDFTMHLGKTISMNEENVFLPLNLNFEDCSLYLRKGKEAFRPGIDQIPGTCMEYYMSDDGIAYTSPEGGALIATHDTPLVYMGEMKHHPIMLCDGKEENNQRPVYSWVMNNKWETNFKMDLSGFGEYRYSLWLSSESDPEKAMDELKEKTFDPYVMIVE